MEGKRRAEYIVVVVVVVGVGTAVVLAGLASIGDVHYVGMGPFVINNALWSALQDDIDKLQRG